MSKDIERKNKKEVLLTQGVAETSSIYIPGYESSSVKDIAHLSSKYSSNTPITYTLLCSIDTPLDIGFSIEYAELFREKEALFFYLPEDKVIRVDNFFSFRGVLPEIVVGGTIIITGEELLSLYAPLLLRQYKEEVFYFEKRLQPTHDKNAVTIGILPKEYDIKLLDNNVRSSFWNTIEFDTQNLDKWEYESRKSIYFKPIYNPPIIIRKEINKENRGEKNEISFKENEHFTHKASTPEYREESRRIKGYKEIPKPYLKQNNYQEKKGSVALEEYLEESIEPFLPSVQKELEEIKHIYDDSSPIKLDTRNLSRISSNKESSINNKRNYDDSLHREVEGKSAPKILLNEEEHSLVKNNEVLIGNIYKDTNYEALWKTSLRVIDIFYRGEQKILGISWKGLYGTILVNPDGSYKYELDSEKILFEDIREPLFETFEVRILSTDNSISSATVCIEITTEKGISVARRVKTNESYYRIGQVEEFLCITSTILNPSNEDLLYFDGLAGTEGFIEYNKTLRQLSAKNYNDIQECENSIARIILDVHLSEGKYTRFVVISIDGYATGGVYYSKKRIYAVPYNEKGRSYVTACDEVFFPEIQRIPEVVSPEFQRRKYTSMHSLSGNVYKESKILCDKTVLEIAKIFYKGEEKKAGVHWQSDYADIIIHKNGNYEYALRESKRVDISSKPIFDIMECSFIDNKGEYFVSHLIVEIISIRDVVQIRRLESDESYYQTNKKNSLGITITILNPSGHDTVILSPIYMGTNIPVEYNNTLKQLTFRGCDTLNDCEAVLQNTMINVGNKNTAYYTRYVLCTIDGYGAEGAYYSSRKVYALPISGAKQYAVILGEEIEEASIHEILFSLNNTNENFITDTQNKKVRKSIKNEEFPYQSENENNENSEKNSILSSDKRENFGKETKIGENTLTDFVDSQSTDRRDTSSSTELTKENISETGFSEEEYATGNTQEPAIVYDEGYAEGISSQHEDALNSVEGFSEEEYATGNTQEPAIVYGEGYAEGISSQHEDALNSVEGFSEEEYATGNTQEPAIVYDEGYAEGVSSQHEDALNSVEGFSEEEYATGNTQEPAIVYGEGYEAMEHADIPEEREWSIAEIQEEEARAQTEVASESEEENIGSYDASTLQNKEEHSSNIYVNGVMKLYTKDAFVLAKDKESLRIGGIATDTVILAGEGWKQVIEKEVGSRYYLQGAYYKHYVAMSNNMYKNVFIADEIKIEKV